MAGGMMIQWVAGTVEWSAAQKILTHLLDAAAFEPLESILMHWALSSSW